MTEAMILRQLLADRDKDVQVASLYASDCVRVKALACKQGSRLPDHVTKVPTLLVVVQGKIAFCTEEGCRELQAGEAFSIPVEEPHWVDALEDSLFLLIQDLKPVTAN